MKIASLICDETFSQDLLDKFTDDYSEHSMLEIIRNLAPSFDDLMINCTFLDKTNCSELFYPIITEEGLCYTFNAMSMKETATDR